MEKVTEFFQQEFFKEKVYGGEPEAPKSLINGRDVLVLSKTPPI